MAGCGLAPGPVRGARDTAAADARRTDNAYIRFLVANHGAKYMIDDFIPNPQATVVAPKTVAALPSDRRGGFLRGYGPAATVGYNPWLRPMAAPSAPVSTG
jgi:hypothetical protein